ncbi:glucosamine-6-phosphate deaminase [Anaerotaenia torta]|uniref:glucosamine-6-phosphate deaminase n=1 Tax=Anaerotaenia torta TaxID=433293 RepID=UPI003D19A0E5
MRIIRTRDYQDMSRKSANMIAAQVILKPGSVLGLATGSSPVGTYKNLVDRYNEGDLDFSQIRTVNLDEYVGLPKDNPCSYYYFMYENLFKHINIDLNNTNVPNGMEPDDQIECQRYDSLIASLGQIDLQLLGLGNNGHIGFNEPCDIYRKSTFKVELAPSTIEANSRFFQSEDEIPRYAYTMGIGTILSAKKILMIVQGEGKADILREVIEGPVTPSVPASILQLHSDVTIVADESALSRLSR